MQPDWPAPAAILPLIQKFLEQCPAGLSEYELLSGLGEQIPFFAKAETGDHNLHLFRRHFLLFHCLYLLEQKYRTEQTGLLKISALAIQLMPFSENKTIDQSTLSIADPVRDYYLDINQLQHTDQDEVDELLGKFWLALARQDARSDALALLDLTDPVDDETIRNRYRQLVMQHHPDRGGDTEMIQQLNSAISKLLPKSC